MKRLVSQELEETLLASRTNVNIEISDAVALDDNPLQRNCPNRGIQPSQRPIRCELTCLYNDSWQGHIRLRIGENVLNSASKMGADIDMLSIKQRQMKSGLASSMLATTTMVEARRRNFMLSWSTVK